MKKDETKEVEFSCRFQLGSFVVKPRVHYVEAGEEFESICSVTGTVYSPFLGNVQYVDCMRDNGGEDYLEAAGIRTHTISVLLDTHIHVYVGERERLLFFIFLSGFQQ